MFAIENTGSRTHPSTEIIPAAPLVPKVDRLQGHWQRLLLADLSTNSLMTTASILVLSMGWGGQNPNGLDRYVYDATRQLAQRHRIQVCGVGLPPELFTATAPGASPPLTPLPMQFLQLADEHAPLAQRLWQVRQNFRRRPAAAIDAVNLHFALYALPLLGDLPKQVPITCTFHGPWAFESHLGNHFSWQRSVKQALESYVYHRCDRYIVLSKAFGQILHQSYRIPEDRIHVIPSGVDLDWFYPADSGSVVRNQLGWPQDRMILFTARRFVERMGFETLIQAIDQVRHQYPEVLLMIAGRGPLEKTLTQLVADLDLQEHVRFLGFVSNSALRQCYQAADVTVVPTQALEGFGLVVVESLACGTPVLCTPVGGMPEIVAPLAPDWITASRHVDDLAAHLRAILRGDLTPPSAEVCRRYAETHYNWSFLAPQLEQVILAPRHS